MHVTFVVPNYLPSIGGAQLLVQRVAEGLIERHGHRVTVLTTDALLSPGGPDPGRVSLGTDHIAGVEVVRLPVARRLHAALRNARRLTQSVGSNSNWFVRWSQPAATGPLGGRLAWAVASAGRDSDVVVAVSSAFLSLPAVRHLANRGGAGVATLPLLHLSHEAPGRAALEAIRASDTTVALTEFERDWLADQRVPSRRLRVIPAGCEPAAFPDCSPTEARALLEVPERPTIGYVGRMAAHKGVDTLIAAMREVWRERPDVNLLLAGSHAGWHEYSRMVEQVADVAGDRLITQEGFSEAEKATLFSACDVVAFPSRAESFGMVTLEAWCARRPVVAGDIGAVRSLIRPGVDGSLVPLDDDAAWGRELVALIEDRERRERLGSAGRQRVEREFEWPRVVDQWHETLVEAATRRGRPSRLGGR